MPGPVPACSEGTPRTSASGSPAAVCELVLAVLLIILLAVRLPVLLSSYSLAYRLLSWVPGCRRRPRTVVLSSGLVLVSSSHQRVPDPRAAAASRAIFNVDRTDVAASDHRYDIPLIVPIDGPLPACCLLTELAQLRGRFRASADLARGNDH